MYSSFKRALAAADVANNLLPEDETVKEKEVTLTKKAGAAEDKEKYRAEKEAINAKIFNIKKQLRSAEEDINRAQVEVDRLRLEPIMPEPSALEEIARVQRLVPNTPPAQKSKFLRRALQGAS